jgi:hypothetical protein
MENIEIGTQLWATAVHDSQHVSVLEFVVHSISKETTETIAKDGSTTTRTRLTARVQSVDADEVLDKIELNSYDTGMMGFNKNDLYYYSRDNAIATAERFATQFISDAEREIRRLKKQIKARKNDLKNLKSGVQ